MKLESSYKLELEMVLKNVSNIAIQNIIKSILTEDDEKQKNAFEELRQIEPLKDFDVEEYRNYLLGFCYRLGVGVPQNFDNAKECFLLAQKNKFSQNELGLYFCERSKSEEERKLGFEWSYKAAEQGLANAQLRLGKIYSCGWGGITENKILAMEWCKKAAEQGLIDAQIELAGIYWYGRGIISDIKLAMEWYTKAAEQGLEHVQMKLARIYDHGACEKGVAKNKNLAIKWYTKAAEQGSADAQSILATGYLYGDFGANDKKLAVEWCRRLAEQPLSSKRSDGQFMLGEAYWYGYGVVSDRKLAMEWYTMAAEHGSADAQNSLARRYWHGEDEYEWGVAEDKKLAVKWYTRLAEHPSDLYKWDAHFTLAEAYWYGKGVAEDKKIAVEWYKRAEKNLNFSHQMSKKRETQIKIAEAYWYGKGVAEDKKISAEWYRRAAGNGDNKAQYMLGVAYLYGYGVPQDKKSAAEWFSKAVYQGNTDAQCFLTEICEINPEIIRDNKPLRGHHLYLAAQGDAQSQFVCSKIFNVSTLKIIENDNIHGIQVNKIIESLNPGTEILELDGKYIQDEGATILAKNLKENKYLKGLMLGACGIGEKGAIAISEALEVNTTLQCLTLWGNNITSKGIHAIFQAIMKNPSTGIQQLWLAGNEINIETVLLLKDILQKNKNLRFIVMGKDIAKPIVLGDGFNKEHCKDFPCFRYDKTKVRYVARSVPKNLKDHINCPFFNFWTEDSLTSLIREIHWSLACNREIAYKAIVQMLDDFLHKEFDFRDKEQINIFYQLCTKFLNFIDNIWLDEELGKFHGSICNKVIYNADRLPTLEAIQFLSKLPLMNISCWGAIQYELAKKYEKLNDITQFEYVLKAYQIALDSGVLGFLNPLIKERIQYLSTVLKFKTEFENYFSDIKRLQQLELKSLIEMGKKRYAEQCRNLYHHAVNVINQLEKIKAPENIKTPDYYLEHIKQLIGTAVEGFVKTAETAEDRSWILELCSNIINDPNCQDEKLKGFLNYHMAQCFEQGINDLPADDQKSLSWYQKALEQGYSAAADKIEYIKKRIEAANQERARQSRISECIKSYEKILELIKTCEKIQVEQYPGGPIAFFDNHYHTGKKCIEELRELDCPSQKLQDLQQADPWVNGLLRLRLMFPEQAIDLLKPWAQKFIAEKEWLKIHFQLAFLYENAKDKVNANIELAQKWYQVALTHGCSDAQVALKALAKRKSQEELNLSKILSQALTPLQEFSQKQAEASEKHEKAINEQTLALRQQTNAMVNHTGAVVDHTAAIIDQTALLRAAFQQKQKELQELSKKHEAEVLQYQLSKQQELKTNHEHEYLKNLAIFDQAQRRAMEDLQEKIRALEDEFKKMDQDKTLNADKCEEWKQIQEFLCQQYQAQQELLLKKEKLQKEQEQLMKAPSVSRFYRTLELRLRAFFHGSLSLASGLIERGKNTKEDSASKLIGLAGDLIPQAGILAKIVTEILGLRAEHKMQSEAEKAAELMMRLMKFNNLDILIEEVARKLAQKYEIQIMCLSENGAAKLSECAARYMIHHIVKTDLKKLTETGCLLQHQLIKSVEVSDLILKGWVKKTQPETIKDKQQLPPEFLEQQALKLPSEWPLKDWTCEAIFQRSGMCVISDKSSKVILYSFPKCRYTKYGFRASTTVELPENREEVNSIGSKA